jgi:hypothetical protein
MRAEIEATWDWIVANTRDGDTAPLAAFGAWIDAPGLDPGWRLKRAREVLSLGSDSGPRTTRTRQPPAAPTSTR